MGAPAFLARTLVILPALDEEESVAETVRHWLEWGGARVRVVDNGSADGTAERAAGVGAEVVPEPRRGYGAAAWTGTRDLPAGIDWILFASADGSDHLDEPAAAAFDSAAAGGAALVVGERVSRPDARRHLSAVQRFGNGLCCRLIQLGWRAPRFRDVGSLRLVSREAFEAMDLRDRAFGWNIEMQVAVAESGLPVVEVPVGYRPRTAGRPKISGSLPGAFRAGRDIIGTLTKLWWRRGKRWPAPPKRRDESALREKE